MARQLLNGRRKGGAGLGMTPWTVAEVVARRARRKASEAFFRVRGPTTLESLCLSYGVSSIDELAIAALTSSCTAWCGVENRARTIDALKKIEGALPRAIQRAEAAAALQFDYFGTP